MMRRNTMKMKRNAMKKMASLLAMFMLIAGFLEAQEQAQEAPAQPQMPPPAYAKLWMGDLTIHGRLLTGFRAAATDQEGLAEDDNWSLQAMNADWQENRTELTLDYSFTNFGAFLMLQARAWSPNTYGGSINPRYAFIWAESPDKKVKFSFGKLYDEIMILQNKVWKTEGFGDLFRFTDEDKFSARVEVKPITGLNVGAQFFFVDTKVNAINSGRAERNLADTGAWKEIGIGAMYTHNLFNAQLGIRFDSDVDIMSRDDSKTYLSAYYGDASMLGTEGAYFLGPKYKYKDEVIGKAKFDSSYNVTGYEETPFYSGGHYAFFGFKLKAVKNLDLDAHGGLYNLGAFDKFGYGRFAERFLYKNLVPKLGLGAILQQEFYGGDVFPDTMENSPFLQFGPQFTYDFAYLPGTQVAMLQATLTGLYGVSPDVLDTYVYVRAALNMQMGVFSALFFYDITFTDFVDKIENVPATQYTAAGGIKPETKHVIGLALNFMF